MVRPPGQPLWAKRVLVMALKNGLNVIKNDAQKVLDGLNLLADLRVMVGIPGDKTPRKEGKITNAALLYIHENGAPEVGIPARPTMKPGLKDEDIEIKRRLKMAGQAALDGKPQSVRNQFAAAGMAGVKGVKNRIASNTPPPLKPATIAARKRRGVKRTNTLIDTGQMNGAVTYVIRNAKDEK